MTKVVLVKLKPMVLAEEGDGDVEVVVTTTMVMVTKMMVAEVVTTMAVTMMMVVVATPTVMGKPIQHSVRGGPLTILGGKPGR